VNLTVIPARGGSKGIKKKNLQTINGKTLIERAVVAASKIPNNRIIVSSDSVEILESVKAYDVEALYRSEQNSSDSATSEAVVMEVLSKIDDNFNSISLLQATSPFVDIEAWQTSLMYLQKQKDIGSIFSAIKKNEFIWELGSDWSPVNHDKKMRLPRQQSKLNVVETGSFYVFRKELFKIEQSRFCGKTEPCLTKFWSSFDIDSIEELEFCRKIAEIVDSM
jgi:N-acylneuraminate cytidylyltransferase